MADERTTDAAGRLKAAPKAGTAMEALETLDALAACARECLLRGQDEPAFTLTPADAIAAFEEGRAGEEA